MDFAKLTAAMADLVEEDIMTAVREVAASESGASATACLEALQQGMDAVGARFEEGEYFVGDLIYAGEVLQNAMDILKPLLAAESGEQLGRLIICTVQHDLHDIGKNIVKTMLEAGGFEVVDLGIDVPPEKIVQTALDEGIRIIALSGVLTTAVDSMRGVVEAFLAAGLREEVRIIIGGNPVSAAICQTVGADDWAHNPQKGVAICRQWAQELAG
ncbi:MAG: cobalamin-dependent protein [Coriobacteriia bacterium]|nr:cobalamin-dependent protein [Coriobacteriia bacterium]